MVTFLFIQKLVED
ncbi:hypothetical protein ECEC4437_1300, partial [Escherichia coli EC4437]